MVILGGSYDAGEFQMGSSFFCSLPMLKCMKENVKTEGMSICHYS